MRTNRLLLIPGLIVAGLLSWSPPVLPAATGDPSPPAGETPPGHSARPDSAIGGRATGDDTTTTEPVRSVLQRGATAAAQLGARVLPEEEDITAEQLWRREPPGFDRHSLRRARELVTSLPGRLPELARGARERRAPLILFSTLGLVAVFLNLALRRLVAIRIARQVGQTLLPLRTRMPDPIGRSIASSVRLLPRVLVPGTILGVYHLVRRLTHFADPWFVALGDFLLGWVILATSLGLLHELLLGGLLPGEKSKGRALYRDLRLAALIGFFGLVAVALARRAGADPGVLALARFLVQLALLVSAGRALRRRDAVLGLFPAVENRLYTGFLRWLRRFYSPAFLFTFVVLLLGLLGYRRLSEFLLVRSWLLVAIFVVTVGLHTGLLSFLRKVLLQDDEPREEARNFYRSIVTLVTYVLVLGVGGLILRLLGLLGPISRLLGTDLITAGDQSISALDLIQAIVVVLVFIFVARLISNYFDYHVYTALNVDTGVGTAINTMVMWVMAGAGLFIGMNSVGLDLRILTLFAGGIGVGLGFGLQNFANNLASGMTLIFGRNLRRGDYVTVGEHEGFVRQVGIRATLIRSRDAIEYTIPNSEFLQRMIINWSHTSPLIRLHVPVGVSYRANPELVREVLLEVAENNRMVESRPAPEVWFVGYGDSSIDFELLVWMNVRRVPVGAIKSAVYFEAFTALKKKGIEIPFPQRDIHIRSGLNPPGAPDS